MSQWAYLPEFLLEEIFSFLSIRDRYYCSLVCRRWNSIFYSAHVWRELRVKERTFTYRRFNLYQGYQFEISHQRVQRCLRIVGHLFRRIIIEPINNYYNLYEFIYVLKCFLEWYKGEEYPMPLLYSFSFTFSCDPFRYSSGSNSLVLGTGGKILEELKELLSNFEGLRELTINNLLLETKDTIGILEGFLKHNRESLVYLEIVNPTKERCSLFHISMFPNLSVVVLSVLQLTENIVYMLATRTAILDLVITQDEYSVEADPVPPSVWKTARQKRPEMQVTLEVRGTCTKDIMLQPGAPVYSIVYKSRHIVLSPETLCYVSDLYNKTLQNVIQLGLPSKLGQRSFSERADSYLVLLVRECPNIKRLVIRERLSTSTLLILASEGQNLEELSVRRNAIIKKCEWPKAGHWDTEFYKWLRAVSMNYDVVEKEIGQKLGQKWQMFSDRYYKKINF